MALFDKFSKKYRTHVMCYNCGMASEITVPKGMTIDSFLKSEACTCPSCGCATLRRVMQVKTPQDVKKPFFQKKPLPTLPPLPPLHRRRLPPRPKPRYRPQVPPEEFQDDGYQQEVDYPMDEPVEEQQQQEPSWTTNPKKINFWTGKEER